MIENVKYLILSLLILICCREAFKFGDSRGEKSKICYRCYTNPIPFTGKTISLGDTIDYGNFLEGRELESYLLNSDTESYSYVGSKKHLPFLRRTLFSYLKTTNLEWISVGGKTYLRQGLRWTRLREKEVPAYVILNGNTTKELFNSEVGEPANEREKRKIDRSLLEMEERIERLKANT